MTQINWKVRLKNKSFWMAMIPAVLLTAQHTARLFGYSFNLDENQELVRGLVNTIFLMLALVGVVSDPTVHGFTDSHRALEYTEPAQPKE
jgi:phi LC3 family holin